MSDDLRAQIEALTDEWIAGDDTTQWGDHTRSRCGRELRAILARHAPQSDEPAASAVIGCGARIATHDPRIHFVCSLPVLHDGPHSNEMDTAPTPDAPEAAERCARCDGTREVPVQRGDPLLSDYEPCPNCSSPEALHPLASIIGKWVALSRYRATFDVPALIAQVEASDWLAQHVARQRQEAAGEALREAADAAEQRGETRWKWPEWLRDRAEQIASGGAS